MPTSADTTQLLADFAAGNRSAADRLIPMVYEELRALAARALRRERPGHTLQTTALVHEAYMKLVDQSRADWKSRAHFFAVASEIIRRILVDHARARGAAKRGGGRAARPLDEAADRAPATGIDLLAVDEALGRLGQLDERHARVVELRFFGGLSVEETAHVLGVSERTVKGDWQMARAWLQNELGA